VHEDLFDPGRWGAGGRVPFWCGDDGTDGRREARAYFENNWGLARPETVGEIDYLVHSPAWALGFQKLAQERGVLCYVEYPEHPTEKYKDIWDFLIQQMKAPVQQPERSSP